jgi:hypothetical protein
MKEWRGSTVYNIWRYRNDMKHGNQIYSEEKTLQKYVGRLGLELWERGNLRKMKKMWPFVIIGASL